MISSNLIVKINTFWIKKRLSNIEGTHILNNEPSLTWYSPVEPSLFWEKRVIDLLYFFILFSQKSEGSKGEYQANEGSLLIVCEPLIFDILLLFQKVLIYAIWFGEIPISFGLLINYLRKKLNY